VKYKVTRSIHHDNEKFIEGDEIELSLHEAKPLLECKAIEQIIKPFSQNRSITHLFKE
jgi:hypothetical protein